MTGPGINEYAAAFDQASASYDEDFGEEALAAHYRQMVYRIADRFLPRGGHILDLGCGTGLDAVRFAGMGTRVLAADVSSGMLARARRRRETSPHENLIQLHRIAENQPLADQLLEAADGPLDGALLNFGVINCYVDLQPLVDALGRVLPSGGTAVVVAMGPFHPITVAERIRRGEWRKQLDTLKSRPVHMTVGAKTISVSCLRPRQIEAAFQDDFKRICTRGLGVLLPPPPLASFYQRHRGLFTSLEPFGRLLGAAPFLHSMGDHNVVVLRRR